MEAQDWNARYAGQDRVWPESPNVWVVQEVSSLPPGRALDLGAGEGRNAIWLAEQGWSVVAVDFAQAALERGRRRVQALAEADGRPLDIEWVCADIVAGESVRAEYDLVLLSYLQLPDYDRRPVVRQAAAAVAGGGTLLVIGHDSTNLVDGYGGPQDASVLYSAADIEDDLQDHLHSASLVLERSGRIAREVDTDDGPRVAWDVLVRARRRDMTKGEVSFEPSA